MKMSSQHFLDWKSKSITLLAMSGAGKTTLANKLPRDKWFHYSADYRIGTKYLGEFGETHFRAGKKGVRG